MNPSSMKIGNLYKIKPSNIAIYEGVEEHRSDQAARPVEWLRMRHVGARGKLFWVNREAVISEVVEGGAMANPELDNYSGRPQIVTLCGSTRFTDEMLKEAWRLTLEGKIVIHWNVVNFVGDHAAESLGDDVKARIDELYLHKVAMADVVHIINVGGYVGESTRKELAHARKLGKPVTWLEIEHALPF